MPKKMTFEEEIYYVKKNRRISGPYYLSEMHRFLLVGRCTVFDGVSLDCITWEPIHGVAELIPEEMLTVLDLSVINQG